MADIGDGSVACCLAHGARVEEHGGITWGEYVAHLAAANDVHGLTDVDIDWLLWECTAWPTAGFDYVRRQLLELFANWKGVPRE